MLIKKEDIVNSTIENNITGRLPNRLLKRSASKTNMPPPTVYTDIVKLTIFGVVAKSFTNLGSDEM
jgi:hypothetical protein